MKTALYIVIIGAALYLNGFMAAFVAFAGLKLIDMGIDLHHNMRRDIIQRYKERREWE